MTAFTWATRAGAAAVVATMLGGCVTSGQSGGPSLARFNDPSDDCQAHRQPLIATESKLGETMVMGAVIGSLAGAGLGAAMGDGDTDAVLAGAMIGGLLGGTVGYQEGLSQRHSTREAILTEINQDAGADAVQFSSTRGLIGSLNGCRNQQIDAIHASYDAGRIDKPQARARLDQVRRAVEQDNELVRQVLGHMARRADTYLNAARRTTDLDDGAILGATKDYTPGTLFPQESAARGERMEVKATSANLRAGPGTSHRVVGGVRQGDVVTVAARHGDWTRIAHDTEPAFIHASLLSPSVNSAGTMAPPPNRPQIKTDLQRAVVEARDAEAAGEQTHAQLSSRLDDMYAILGVN